MKWINAVLAILLSSSAFSFFEPAVYKNTNEYGTYAEYYARISFSEFEPSDMFRIRIDFTVTGAEGKILYRKKDYREFKAGELNAKGIKYFDAYQWGDIKPGEYTLKATAENLSTGQKIEKELPFSIGKGPFADNVLVNRAEDDRLPSGVLLFGEEFAFKTVYSGPESVIAWSFALKNGTGEGIYEIKQSTVALSGPAAFITPFLRSANYDAGEYSALFTISDTSGNPIAVNERRFKIAYPEFGIDLSGFPMEEFKYYSSAISKENIKGRSVTVVVPALLSGYVTCGLIRTLYEEFDVRSASVLNIYSNIVFNAEKEIIRWDITALNERDALTTTSLNIDFANNKDNPVVINEENPILSIISYSTSRKKVHELKRVKKVMLFPYLNIWTKEQGDTSKKVDIFFPDLYNALKRVFGYNFTKKNKFIYINSSGQDKGIDFDANEESYKFRVMQPMFPFPSAINERCGNAVNVNFEGHAEMLTECSFNKFNVKIYKDADGRVRKYKYLNVHEADLVE